MSLFVDRIDYIGHTKGQSGISHFHAVCVLQFNVADAKAMLIAVVATLVESSANSQGKAVVIEKIIMAANFSIGRICLFAVCFLVRACKEAADCKVGRYALGGDSDNTLEPVPCLAALEVEIPILRRGGRWIVVIVDTECKPPVGIADAQVHLAVFAIDGVTAHDIGKEALVLIAHLGEHNGSRVLRHHLHAAPNILGL